MIIHDIIKKFVFPVLQKGDAVVLTNKGKEFPCTFYQFDWSDYTETLSLDDDILEWITTRQLALTIEDIKRIEGTFAGYVYALASGTIFATIPGAAKQRCFTSIHQWFKVLSKQLYNSDSNYYCEGILSDVYAFVCFWWYLKQNWQLEEFLPMLKKIAANIYSHSLNQVPQFAPGVSIVQSFTAQYGEEE